MENWIIDDTIQESEEESQTISEIEKTEEEVSE
jgi:hypothetical protein